MGFVVGIIVFFIALGVIYSWVGRSIALRLLRPYIGLFLIAALIVVLGGVVNVFFGGMQGAFFFIAKIITVFTCAALCLHLIVIIGKRFLRTTDNDDA